MPLVSLLLTTHSVLDGMFDAYEKKDGAEMAIVNITVENDADFYPGIWYQTIQ